MFKNKKVLVTGGTGMIGRELVELLIKEGSDITTCSLDDIGIFGTAHVKADLTDKNTCQYLCDTHSIVFHLAGVKGSPDAAINRPASFFVPMLQFNTNMAQAALNAKCQYLYTSSVGVYQPAPLLKEDDVDTTVPSRNDWYAGWAKRIGEMQLKAYEIQNGWRDYSIIRPANVYGTHDNFDLKNCMVIPSLIKRMVDNDEVLELHGDGSNVRDFVHSKDVARAMIYMMENNLTGPYNIGSGDGVTIKDLVYQIAEVTGYKGEIRWLGGQSGDKIRLMDMTKLFELGYKNIVSLHDGIEETVRWYKDNKNFARFDYFKGK